MESPRIPPGWPPARLRPVLLGNFRPPLAYRPLAVWMAPAGIYPLLMGVSFLAVNVHTQICLWTCLFLLGEEWWSEGRVLPWWGCQVTKSASPLPSAPPSRPGQPSGPAAPHPRQCLVSRPCHPGGQRVWAICRAPEAPLPGHWHSCCL